MFPRKTASEAEPETHKKQHGGVQVEDEPETHKPHQREEEPPAKKADKGAAQPHSAPPAVNPFAIPPLFGKTPTSISQILASTLGSKGTHFTGPVVSGGTPGSGVAQGSALLALAIQVDYTMGAFSLPLQFPADALILWATTLVYTAFAGGTGDTSFTLGKTTGAADVLAAHNMGALHAVSIVPAIGTLPLPSDANPGQLWINVTPNGNTAGQGIIVLLYMRPFFKWS
jgi:hypothetical protein